MCTAQVIQQAAAYIMAPRSQLLAAGLASALLLSFAFPGHAGPALKAAAVRRLSELRLPPSAHLRVAAAGQPAAEVQARRSVPGDG